MPKKIDNLLSIRHLSAWDRGTAEAELAIWLKKYSKHRNLSNEDMRTIVQEILEGRVSLLEMALANLAHKPNQETMDAVFKLAKEYYGNDAS